MSSANGSESEMAYASSTLVNIAEDAEMRLVRLIAGASAATSDVKSEFVAACEGHVDEGDAGGLLAEILGYKEANNVAFISAMTNVSIVSDDAAASACSLACSMFKRVEDAAQASQLLKQFCDAIVSFVLPQDMPPADAAAIRRRQAALVATLYNMCADTTEKVSLLTHVVRLMSKAEGGGDAAPTMLEMPGMPMSNLLALTTTSQATGAKVLPHVVVLLDGWDITPEQRRDLYQSLADGVADVVTKQRFALLLVETYDAATANDATALKYAKLAAIGAIQDPVTLFDEQRSILTYPAIVALKAKESKLFALLEIIQQKQLADYEAYIKGNPLDASWGIDADKCKSNIRILTLCTLAGSKQVSADDHTLPYDDIAKSLQLSEGESGTSTAVESWVIKTMNSGLLQAKMDQLNQVVIVERTALRSFDMEQWKQLQTKLHTWKDHVGSILKAYRQQQQQMQA
mmetsp:Transcript_14755/g.41780  ORF Transcript_14755/g.41780 Transcript_14755/m.41780 type:complete len:460 (+) Transcript_14755:257-1636(+)|eukprot:CAMPEP_0119557432 /NCGR_PEP_ID=MMETSP1352-20130426/9102_1 /TAXON_ID=265584 /ORGANISM="Stauroneis constricta, Strain CCMP1120" /LENGTH=459 /DNA_ID=CAMNT_0007604539 /DNA_START=180 /DNA_END=1559 /DNA_ORIENTATION=+